MKIRYALLAIALGGSSAFVARPVTAREYIEIDTAPPVVREEVVPGPRHGYLWVPGYWEWRGHEHFWVEGHWLASRHGYHWEAAHWVEYHHRWHLEPGIWVRD